MNVYRLDTNGTYDTLTEEELNKEYSKEEIQGFKDSEDDYLFITGFTPRQLNRCRKLKHNTKYMEDFEENFDICPDVYDLLKHLYS